MIKSVLNPVLHLAAVLLARVNTTAARHTGALFVPTKLEYYTASMKPEKEV